MIKSLFSFYVFYHQKKLQQHVKNTYNLILSGVGPFLFTSPLQNDHDRDAVSFHEAKFNGNEKSLTHQPQSSSSWLSLLPSLLFSLLSRLHVHPSGSAPAERGRSDYCLHKLHVCRGAEGLSEQ